MNTGPRWLGPALLGAVVITGYFASSLLDDVYSGVPRSVPISGIDAQCRESTIPKCTAMVVRLNAGRFHVQTPEPASGLTITLRDAKEVSSARVLLLRTDRPGRLVLENDAVASPRADFQVSGGVRSAMPLLRTDSTWNRMTFTPLPPDGPIAIAELGFFESDQGLLTSTHQPFSSIVGARFYRVYMVLLTFAVYAFVLAAAWYAPDLLRRLSPWVLGVLCVAVCLFELGTTFSPYLGNDLRSLYGFELVESGSSGNLTGGPYAGSRLVQGLGETEPPGIVPWHRMPGYGLFCGLAAVVGRTTDVVDIAATVVLLQVLLYGASVGLFVAAATRLFPPWTACVLGVAVTLLPTQLNYTQVDSIISSIALLVAAALCVHIAARRARPVPPLRTFLLVNVAFALWFVMRNDVLPGWIVVSLLLAERRWRYAIVPILLMTTIAVPWALYKRTYTREFSLLPANTGEVLFLSLCEVPGRFPYPCTDPGYFKWATRISHSNPTSQRASNRAVQEVVRYWLTYPVHFGFMVISKFRRCVFSESWPGIHTRFTWPYRIGRDAGLFLVLLAAVVVAIAVDHERRRSMLLGWALFLNMPMFFIAYESSGRFYSAASVAAVVAAVPLLLERDFYAQIARRRRRAAAILACLATLAIGGGWIEYRVRKSDSLHYWAPLLDPRRSTLAAASR